MLKMTAKSKRGRQQIKRHGDIWVPIDSDQRVSVLGGVPGIKLMSARDRAVFWMKVMEDENLVPVARVDPFGRPIAGKSGVTLSEMVAEGQEKMGVAPRKQETFTGTGVKRADGSEELIREYSTVGVTSGRTRASGEPGGSQDDHSAHEQAQEQASSSLAT